MSLVTPAAPAQPQAASALPSPLRLGMDAGPVLYPQGGIGEYTVQVLHRLRQLHPLDLRLFTLANTGEVAPLPSGVGAAHLHNRVVRRALRLARRLWHRAALPLQGRSLRRLHLFHSTNFLVPVLPGVPLVVTVHDLTVLKFPQWHPQERIAYMTPSFQRLHLAHRVMTDSEQTRRDLLELVDLPPEQVVTVYLGCGPHFNPHIPAAQVAQVRARYDLTRPYVLHPGTLQPRKNLVRLMAAFHKLRRAQARDHLLVLAGPRGWMDDEVFEAARRLGLAGTVRFLGHVPEQDLPALVRGADLLAYPSLYEGFGLPALEGMACGTPVLTSNISSLPEVVGDAAVLVDPYDVDAIADGMARLLDDTALRQALVQRGLARARQFTWERTTLGVLEVYAQALHQAGADRRRTPS